jgi:hypothetical protein
MKRKIALAVVAAVLAALAVAYYRLGGFEKPVVQKQTVAAFRVVGQKFAGKRNDRSREQLFRQTHELLKKGTLKGVFTVVYEGDPDAESDSLRCFVGIALDPADSVALPEGFTAVDFPPGESITATVSAYVLVAPNPATVNAQIRDFAKENGMALQPLVIEKYYHARQIVTEMPIAANR